MVLAYSAFSLAKASCMAVPINVEGCASCLITGGFAAGGFLSFLRCDLAGFSSAA